ncbi:MXAN_6230/SCO0854 family RING domain-containing protein [Flindersiella endophytica]
MDELADVLLRRRTVVPELAVHATKRWLADRMLRVAVDVETGVRALEAEALQRGFLFSAGLRHALRALPAEDLMRLGHGLLNGLDQIVGTNVKHVPLFRRFPHSVPADTGELYVRRMFAYLVQEPNQPCVLCGTVGSVRPVSPCAHLVCRYCWDGSDLSGCPICHRRIPQDDPFLQPSEPSGRDAGGVRREGSLVLLSYEADANAMARDLTTKLLARETPLSPQDRLDLAVFAKALPGHEWLPDRIPVREARAIALAGVLPSLQADPAIQQALVDQHVDTATDVLRLLYALMDGDPGLRRPPATRTSVRRSLRRALLARMERMPVDRLAEDLFRHAEPWKHLTEVLHPFEYHRRFPRVALAFAAVRGTKLDGDTAFAHALAATAGQHTETFEIRRGQPRLKTFNGLVENALRAGDGRQAVELLRRRPGELVRRLCQLLRAAPLQPVLDALRDVAPDVAPGVLIATLGQLRTPPGVTRLFFPSGGSAKAWTQPGTQPPLPAEAVRKTSELLTGELLRRAESLPPLGRVLLDDGLASLLAPTAERSASSAKVRLPRGSTQQLPFGERLRFFLHWAEPRTIEVDLDLSVALFDESWTFIGLCSYTNLRYAGTAAVHSGDLTSAPQPLGASEFIDLDLPALRKLNARYVLPTVFSFNDVPFEKLERGFAGFMTNPDGLFDPLAVEQRFELSGPAKILLLLVADLWTRTFRWVDLNLGGRAPAHSVEVHESRLGGLGAAVEDVFGLGDRVTLWELACWNAAARGQEVIVRRTNGDLGMYIRRPDESTAGFATRLIALTPPDAELSGDALPAGIDYAALVHGNADLPDGVSVYALYPWRLDPTRLRILDAADLAAEFASVRVRPVQVDLGVEPDTESRSLG